MVLVQLKFQCDRCPAHVEKWVRLGPHFYLAADQIPDGWKIVEMSEFNIRINCPQHAMDR